jgi:hypothetical protein
MLSPSVAQLTEELLLNSVRDLQRGVAKPKALNPTPNPPPPKKKPGGIMPTEELLLDSVGDLQRRVANTSLYLFPRLCSLFWVWSCGLGFRV